MAGRTRLTKTAILEAALDSYYAVVMQSPDLTLGYVQVARPGDIDPKQLDASCVNNRAAPVAFGSPWVLPATNCHSAARYAHAA